MMNRHLKACVAVVSLLVVAAMVHAGAQARIEGLVTDLAGNPIAGATINITTAEVSGFKKVVITDADGEFKTLILDATRHYTFRVEAEGFQPQELPFKVGAGTTDNFFDFKLKTIDQAAAAEDQQLLQQPGYKELEEAKVLMKAGDTEGARAKFAEAVAAKPDLLPALGGLAELNYDAGDMEGALAAALKCLEEDDESLQCLAIAVNASGELGDETARVEYMARYQALNPEDPTILFNEAAVFLNKLDDEGARPLLERCLEADPNLPQCNFEYGMLLLRTGDMEGAKTYLQKYLEVAPDGPLASTAEETIKYL
jgi:Tfp pilus assembly protein PilF